MFDALVQKAYAAGVVSNPTGNGGTSFNTLLQNILNQVVDPIIYLIFALAVVYFLWGVFLFIKKADSEEERKIGSDHIIWGLVGMFVMISAKGIINLILSSI